MKEESIKAGGERMIENNLQPDHSFAFNLDGFSDCNYIDKQVWIPSEMALADLRIIITLTESPRDGGAKLAIRR